jgi:hypothetical protein
MDKEKIRASFETHRSNPNVTTDEYVRSRRIELGKSVMRRERVYLDKCFWIILRDAALGRRVDQSSITLLEALRARVRSKNSICPISDTLFVELLKQQDLSTRKATAVLIDELSEGVTLAPHHERIATEIAHLIHSHSCCTELHPLADLVWLKLSYILGVQHPTNTVFDEDEERVIQKAFFDHVWDYSLSKMFDVIGADPPPVFDFEATAKKLNEGNSQHADEIKSFSQCYKVEMIGGLSLLMSVAREVLEENNRNATGQRVRRTEDESREYEIHLFKCFSKGIETKAVALALRTLHIGALCHAAIRWDKKRRLTGNDLHDFHRAEAAVGYCDVFLTEIPLRTMLQQNHLGLNRDFSCKIISSLSEAADWANQSKS